MAQKNVQRLSGARPVMIGVLVLLTCMLATTIPSSSGAAPGPTWNATNRYPGPFVSGSCAQSGGYLYCVGGSFGNGTDSSSVEYAIVSSSGGVGSWLPTWSYPNSVNGQSCAATDVAIYCVGGTINSTRISNATYFAFTSLVGGLPGPWIRTTDFPINITLESCLAASGYIYCFGGNSSKNYTDSVYSAHISPSGSLGTWSATTSYPRAVGQLSCVAANGGVYCVGGYGSHGAVYQVFKANLMAGGVGNWSQDSPMLNNVGGQGCVASTSIYCIGGLTVAPTTNVYTAQPEGNLTWISYPSYPVAIGGQSCVFASTEIVCVGGTTGTAASNLVYFSRASSTTTTSTPTTTVTSTKVSTVTNTVTTSNDTTVTVMSNNTQTVVQTTTVKGPVTIETQSSVFTQQVTSVTGDGTISPLLLLAIVAVAIATIAATVALSSRKTASRNETPDYDDTMN